MQPSRLCKLYLSDSDELVNRECLRGLQMVNVFHSRLLRLPKERRVLWLKWVEEKHKSDFRPSSSTSPCLDSTHQAIYEAEALA